MQRPKGIFKKIPIFLLDETGERKEGKGREIEKNIPQGGFRRALHCGTMLVSRICTGRSRDPKRQGEWNDDVEKNGCRPAERRDDPGPADGLRRRTVCQLRFRRRFRSCCGRGHGQERHPDLRGGVYGRHPEPHAGLPGLRPHAVPGPDADGRGLQPPSATWPRTIRSATTCWSTPSLSGTA